MSLIYNAIFDKNTRKLSFEDKAGNEIYSCTIPERVPAVDDITKPLTFKATQDGSTVILTKYGSPTGSFQTSNDGGNTWEDYTIDTAITLNTGDEVSFRAKANRTSAQTNQVYFQFTMTGKIEAWHNVMSMYRTNDFATYEYVVDYAFYQLFSDCTSLTKAPELPATQLRKGCYQTMFNGCTSLTKAPDLPATSLDDQCYWSMFSSCTSLTKAPELPATQLYFYCYHSMFFGCTSLTKAPDLPATSLAESCYNSMFQDCTSLTKAPDLPATILAVYCYQTMFNGCTSLTKAPELPVTQLRKGCYLLMFRGCTSLTKAPVLPATTLEERCYYSMFSGCTVLTEVRISATKTAKDALKNWLAGVSATGDFYCDPNATIFPTDDVSGIPTGWRRVDVDDPKKPLMLRAIEDNSSVTLEKRGTLSNTYQTSTNGKDWTDYRFGTQISLNKGESVYFRCSNHPTKQSNSNYVKFVMTGKIEAWHNAYSMISSDFSSAEGEVGNYGMNGLFEYCRSLTKAPLLLNALSTDCYYGTFYGCSALTQAPALPATNLADHCYFYMFYGCTSLTSAPQLPATTLADYCYSNMFKDCTALKEVRISATTTATGALTNWLSGVSATGDFYCDPNATYFLKDSESGIPKGWTRHALSDYPATP